ncbi:sigma-70 family RNA polymerase sigma factor [bacterium]|nr:sigma-70 family RNA polymerase sigma factor [bacterium]
MDRDGQILWQSFCATTDEVAFEALYENYRSLVWTLCWRVLGTEDDARDAFQATWTRIYALAREEGSRVTGELVVPLIYRLSIREADALKKRRIRRGRREIVMDELPVVPSGAVPADEMAAAAERRTRLETVVAMLPDKYRLPIQLHYLHGMTQVQIAQMMDIPRSTVAARLTRGLRKLMPLAERAGLGEVAGILGAVAVGGALMAPPKALAATAVYFQIQSAIAAGASTAALAAGASATISKTILGVTVMQAKAALVSGVLLLAAATAIGFHYHNRDNNTSKTTVASNNITVVKPTPAPTVVVVKQTATDAGAKKPVVAKETPKATPTPTPTPEGPMRDLRVAVIWEETQLPAEGTSVSLQLHAATDRNYPYFAKTNADGIAVVKLPESWTKIRLRAQHVDSRQNLSKAVEPATVEQPVMFALKRGGRAYGTVKTADGRPAAAAEIQAWNEGQLRKAVSKPDGSFEVCQLPPGETRFIATLQKLRSDIKDPKGLSMTAVVGQKVGPVALTLEPGLTVSGVVTASKTGQPVPGATVTIPNDSRFQNSKTLSDLAGRFTVEGLPQARVTLVAKAENFAGQARIVQPAPGTISKCDFALNPGGEVEATVVDEKGNPVEGATLRVSYNTNYMLSDSNEQVKTDSSGRATLKNLVTDDRMSVSASKSPNSGSQDVVFPPGELKATVKLTMKPSQRENQGGPITGTVTDENGKPLQDINLYYGYMSSSTSPTPHAKTDAAGKYRIDATYNQYYLTAWGDGWGTEIKSSVNPGTKDKPTVADFTMKPGHYLAGLVVDEKDTALANVQISLSPYNSGGSIPNSNTKTDSAGKFRIENLSDMKFNVQFSGTDIPSQSQTASIDTENKFVLKPMGTIKGRVLDKDTKKPIETFAMKISGNSIDYNLRTTGQAFSSPDGKFELKELKKDDSYDLTVESKGYSSHTEEKVVAKAGDSTEEVTIYVSKGDAMRGILIDEKTNTPIAGALVAYGSPKNSWFSWRVFTDRGYDSNMNILGRVVTGIDGRFEINVDDEHQMLYILPRAHKRMILSEADRAKYKHDKEYVITIPAGAVITGKAFLDGKIQPQTQVYLNQQRTDANGQSVDFGDIKTDDQGVFTMGGLDAGEYTMSGPQRRYGNMGIYAYNRKVTLKDGETKEVNLGDNLGNCLMAGAVLNSGQPVPMAHISLSPTFDWYYTSISVCSDENGVYTMDGLVPGKYNANVYKYDDRTGQSRYQVNEVVEVKEGTTEHNFERGGHKLTGRLVFDENSDPKYRASFKNAMINFTSWSGQQQDQVGPRIDQYAQCEIKNGVLTFDGRFKGEYQIRIMGDYQSGNNSSMMLQQKFQIDNTEADQDLGDIPVPATGRIRINVKLADSSVKPRYLMALVSPAGSANRQAMTQLQIDPSKGEQSIGPVPTGDVEVRVMGEAARCDPPSANVTVTAGAEAGPLNFTMTLTSDVMVYAITPANQASRGMPSPIAGAKVTLSGNGVQRQLVSSGAPVNEQTAMAAYASNQDVSIGPMFMFRNVPDGTFTVTIEAPGFKPFTQQAQAGKGKMCQIQARLQKQ